MWIIKSSSVTSSNAGIVWGWTALFLPFLKLLLVLIKVSLDCFSKLELAWVQERHDLGKNSVRNVVDNNFCHFRLDEAGFALLAEHGFELIRKLRDNNSMAIELFAFNEEDHVRKLFFVQHACETTEQFGRLVFLCVFYIYCEVWARISIEDIHIFQIVLTVATSDYVEFAVDESHWVTSPCFGVLVYFWLMEVVAMLPGWGVRVEGIEVVEAECMRTTSSEQKESVVDVAEFHTCTGSRTFTYYFNLGPDKGLQIEDKQVIQTLLAIPTSENVQVVLDNAWAVVCSRRRSWSSHFDYVAPMEGWSIQLVEIIKIVSSISTSEYVDLVFKTVSSVHVARTWRFSREVIVDPPHLLQVKNVHIISCKRTCSKPTTDNVQTVLNQCCCVPISSLRRRSCCLSVSHPAISLGVKHSEVTMVLLPIIAAENKELIIKQRSRVVLNLRSL